GVLPFWPLIRAASRAGGASWATRPGWRSLARTLMLSFVRHLLPALWAAWHARPAKALFSVKLPDLTPFLWRRWVWGSQRQLPIRWSTSSWCSCLPERVMSFRELNEASWRWQTLSSSPRPTGIIFRKPRWRGWNTRTHFTFSRLLRRSG